MTDPASLEMSMTGPEGLYRLTYNAGAGVDGKIDVEIAGIAMTWFVEVVRQKNEGIALSGMTTGSQVIWQDQFWFEFLPEADPPRINYWADRVLWRTDLHLDP